MTITLATGIAQRIWRGYDDPGLPVGMYLALSSVTGDMSGGSMNISFRFRGEGQPISGRFYNVEQLEVNRTGAPIAGNLASVNFSDSVGPTGLINWERRLSLSVLGGVLVNGLNLGESGITLPLFLGTPEANVDLAGELIVGFANTDGLVLAAGIQGYIWEGRSVMAEGGLRRPVDSLYGR